MIHACACSRHWKKDIVPVFVIVVVRRVVSRSRSTVRCRVRRLEVRRGRMNLASATDLAVLRWRDKAPNIALMSVDSN